MQTVVYDRWYLAEKRRRCATAAPPRPRPRIDHREADPRRALAAAVAADQRADVTLASLCRMVGRPDGYLARFVTHGQPHALQPEEHRRLAGFFGVDDRGLGIRDLWVTK